MSDNEDLLGDDIGDQSLADYNLGNEEEEQLLADDYENSPQNVPTSVGLTYIEPLDIVPSSYPAHAMEYSNQPLPYQAIEECVVPNITVEVPNSQMERPTYAPYEPRPYEQEHAVPPAIPAAPIESPQIVPSDINSPVSNGDVGGPRERFVSERPPGAQRMPQIRDIPDSLDKVVIPRGGFPPRGRTSWRNPQFAARYPHPHPYRRNHVHRGNFNQRSSFPPPQIRPNQPQMRPEIRPEIRPEMHPDFRPEIRPDIRPDMRPEIRLEPPQIGQDIRLEPPQMGPEISPERPILPQDMPIFRPHMERPPFPNYRFQYRPEERFRPNFEPRPVFFRPNFPRQFAPMREIAPNTSHLPQVTIRQMLPMPMDKGPKVGPSREQEVRMLPVALPPSLPPGGLAGKKVLINPHFKGNFQPPVEGPVKDIDDAAERFIAEQRNALARAAVRKYAARRSPQRYIENTTIEIENELAHASHAPGAAPPAPHAPHAPHAPPRRRSDDELSRRQEEFINANRAGLRRRMRSPSPLRRSPSPRRSPDRRARNEPIRHNTEETEYKRKLREQESLRERVLRAKEVRRRKNAVALHKQLMDKEREAQEKDNNLTKPNETKQEPTPIDKPTSTVPENKPDTTHTSPEKPRVENIGKVVKIEKMEKIRERSPVKKEDIVEVNSTCENLTPPRAVVGNRAGVSPERALTPPLPAAAAAAPAPAPAPAPAGAAHRTDSDDDLDLILGDIDGILSDDEDSGRFKEKHKTEPSKCRPPADLRSKLPAKHGGGGGGGGERRPQRQKIVFHEDKRKKEKSPPAPRRPVVTSSTKAEDTENIGKKHAKIKQKSDLSMKSRPRITFDNKEADKEDDKKPTSFSNRRVILQRKTNQPKEKSVFSRIDVKSDPTKPNPGIFSRAVRTAIGTENNRIVIKKEPEVEFESDSDIDEDKLLEDVGNTASVTNLPHGMTDTRLKTLAGNDVQSVSLDKEERTASITFKNTAAAENFKKKFNNKMVAASRLTVALR